MNQEKSINKLKDIKDKYVKIPNIIFQTRLLTESQKVLLGYLGSFEPIRPTYLQIQYDLRKSDKTIKKDLNRLKELGIITWITAPVTGVNLYSILPVESWVKNFEEHQLKQRQERDQYIEKAKRKKKWKTHTSSSSGESTSRTTGITKTNNNKIISTDISTKDHTSSVAGNTFKDQNGDSFRSFLNDSKINKDDTNPSPPVPPPPSPKPLLRSSFKKLEKFKKIKTSQFNDHPSEALNVIVIRYGFRFEDLPIIVDQLRRKAELPCYSEYFEGLRSLHLIIKQFGLDLLYEHIDTKTVGTLARALEKMGNELDGIYRHKK